MTDRPTPRAAALEALRAMREQLEQPAEPQAASAAPPPAGDVVAKKQENHKRRQAARRNKTRDEIAAELKARADAGKAVRAGDEAFSDRVARMAGADGYELPSPEEVKALQARRELRGDRQAAQARLQAQADQLRAVRQAAGKAAARLAQIAQSGEYKPPTPDEIAAREAAADLEHPQRPIGRLSEAPVWWRCRQHGCSAFVRLEASFVPTHNQHGTDTHCPGSGKEVGRGLSASSLVMHFVAMVATPGATAAEKRKASANLLFIAELNALGRCAEGKHAVLEITPELGNLWEAASLKLSPASQLAFAQKSQKDSFVRYWACTEKAVRSLIVLIGGCNDEHKVERQGNEYGELLDAMIFRRGPRSWRDKVTRGGHRRAFFPQQRRLQLGGDLAGTYTGRHCRSVNAEAFGDGEAVRKARKRPEPIESRRRGAHGKYPSTGRRYERRYVRSRQYLTNDARQAFRWEPECQELVAVLQELCRPKAHGGKHGWLWGVTQAAREGRVCSYDEQILTESDRRAAAQARSIRHAYGQIAARSGEPSYQKANRYAVRARRSGPDGTGLISGASAPAAGNSGTDPPS